MITLLDYMATRFKDLDLTVLFWVCCLFIKGTAHYWLIHGATCSGLWGGAHDCLAVVIPGSAFD